jgi:RNA polymerase sigma factor (sigma-70 family)
MTSSKSANYVTNIQPRLTLDEETNLLRQAAAVKRLAPDDTDAVAYQTALDLGQVARETLVTRNMGLVHYCVKDVLSSKVLNSLSKDDLVQEGAIGLAMAIDKYNPELGTKFSTYAVYWIRGAILRCIAERDDMLRVPSHVGEAVRKLQRAAQTLGVELDGVQVLSRANGACDSAALAEAAGLSDRQLMEAMTVRQRRLTGGYVSFESWMQKGQSMQVDLEATTESGASPDKEKMKSTLARFLRPKEMEAISWRYGLVTQEVPSYLQQAEQVFEDVTKGKWGEAMSFTEVGKHMSCSAEYGRKLCHKALEKLRQAAEAGTLEPALLF